MPRYSRKALCGNFFHVIVQGLNKEYIFYEDNFLEIEDDINYRQIIDRYKLENLSINDIVINLYRLHKLSTRNIAD